MLAAPTPAWRKVCPETMPARGEPVLIRLVNEKVIKSGKAREASDASVLFDGIPYGFQVAVLRYVQDGFGGWHPDAFVASGFDSSATNGGHQLRETYKLNQVSHWAALS